MHCPRLVIRLRMRSWTPPSPAPPHSPFTDPKEVVPSQTPQILSFWMLNGGTVPQPQGLMTRYPLYQLGGPQLRVFRTNFFIKLVRPGVAQPEDTVQFRIPMEMTRVDLRNYLERIYNVPVAAVRTRVQHAYHSTAPQEDPTATLSSSALCFLETSPHPLASATRCSYSIPCCEPADLADLQPEVAKPSTSVWF
ncbi:39S ribosomal protein L23, mitochondrial isoform X3 [Heterocephalus glaber]|uniref:Large ribosomal subunit protein uL23m n=1 Tax=Heterocephalus glaber TaxID=10181 RepID=A0AAX6TCI9_HETGA|nr:39S ribosomal protein L23, mitochondrial isoform X3 [Heterocephalus glaber]